MIKKKEQGYRRKEVVIHTSVIELLQIGADKKKWSLKKFMENILYKEANRQIPYSK